MNKQTLSNYGWIVICVLVISVMVAFATPFGSFVGTNVTNIANAYIEANNNKTDKEEMMYAGYEWDSKFTDTYNHKAKELHIKNKVPENYTYTQNSTVIIGDVPQVKNGDTLETSDYIYTYQTYYSGWHVDVKDKTKTSYEPILESIGGKNVTALNSTFKDCTEMVVSPVLPEKTVTMSQTYRNCPQMTTTSPIPSSVGDLSSTFYGCTSLVTFVGNKKSSGDFSDFTIPSGTKSMIATFQSCNSMRIPPKIPDTVENMSNTFVFDEGLEKLPILPKSAQCLQQTFFGCTNAKTYVGSKFANGDFTNYKIPNGVTSLHSTFRNCVKMTKPPTIPNSVKNMTYVFFGCESLQYLPTIPNGVTNIAAAFQYCHTITQAPVIPGSVTKMNSAFYNCENLVGTITINTNIENLDDYRYMLSYTGITSVNGTTNLTLYDLTH